MNEFVIVSDSTVDLPKEYLQSKQVPIISLSYIMDGVTYEEMDGLSHKEFFEKLRAKRWSCLQKKEKIFFISAFLPD